MSLRLRLLIAMGTVLAVIVVGGLTVVGSQRSYLIDQVDQQLAAAVPFAGPPPGLGDSSRNVPLAPPPDTPISTLFVGFIASGQLTPILRGQLIDDVPALPTGTADLAELVDRTATVDGEAGRTRFRVLVAPGPRDDGHLAVALPLTEVDSAVRRLQLVLVVVGTLALAAIAAAIWWVERLGIKPIRQVTEVADAISSGDRSQRVPHTETRTEAGKLANAFNLMLDERDQIEVRRRQFVADASHELRTPLSSIRGYLELYDQGRFTDSDQVDDMVRRASREAARMNDLVEDLLLLANLDQQRPLRADRVDLARLVDDAAVDARAVQPGRGIVVDVPDGPVEVTGDLFRLQQVVGVLIDNALTHTGTDVEIRLSARPAGGTARLMVADDGPGLDADLADRVFDRFTRGDDSRSRRGGNSGLGLAIARSIVEAHGGRIDLDTAPGRGCTFTIDLPYAGSPDRRNADHGSSEE